LEVTEKLQRSVLKAAGVSESRMTPALFVLRCAAQLFPDDAELRQISLYVRNNRARQGHLRPGDLPPDVALHPLAGGEGVASVSPIEICAGQPTLLVAGSWS
jgi:hypothetical protein